MSTQTISKLQGEAGNQGKIKTGAVHNGSRTKIMRENSLSDSVSKSTALCDSSIKTSLENVTASPSTIVYQDESTQIETKQRPYFHTYDKPFRLHNKLLQPGLYYHGYLNQNKQEPCDILVCDPIHIIAETYDEHRKNWGLLVRFCDRSGCWEEWAMPMKLINSHGEELRGLLLSMGLWISKKGDTLLIEWLRQTRLNKRIHTAAHTGWYSQEDKLAFVLPRRVIGSHSVCFQSEYDVNHDYQSAGTLSGWQTKVAALCQGNPMLCFVLSAAFVGPLLKLIHHEEGALGVHLQGDSSKGKTTALRMAASVWGASSFVKTWQATINGLEGIAASLNDTLLVLDEISQSAPHQIGAVVYALGNGVGKQRANRHGLAKTSARWRIMWISSGERSLEAHMREANLTTKAGQQVRLLNIPATEQSYGLFDSLYDYADGSAFADALSKGYKQHYGHAGITFIQCLIDDSRDLQAMFANALNLPQFTATQGIGNRAAKVFALIAMAGELAIEYGIVPWETGLALEAAATAYRKWHSLHGGGQTEEQQILKAIQTFINKHGDSHFQPLQQEHRIHQIVPDRAGFWKQNSLGRVYCFYPSALEEIVEGFDKVRIAITLEYAGWLIERDKDKRTKKLFLPDGTKKGLYVVQPKETEEEAHSF